MKHSFLIITVFLLSIIQTFASCPEPEIANFDKPLVNKEINISINQQNKNLYLEINTSAQSTFWQTKGSESAVLTVFLDGKYHQDIFLFKGEENFSYKVVLGKLSLGKHKLSVFQNKYLSAQKIGKVKINKLDVKAVETVSTADELAQSHSPFFYARPDTIGKFSDIPLLVYYETFNNADGSLKIRYTVIYTNEDGGTQTTALMARWGRTTDIEWVYELDVKDGKIIAAIIQGANHVTKSFNGKRVYGNHPLIFDVTVNNNFADEGCSISRTAPLPVKADLSAKSRESVMNENPWTYQIMAQEIIREGRVDPNNLGVNTIADLRDYVFAEIKSELNNSSISIEAKGTDGKIYQSDFGKPLLRVSRSGFVRIALLFPRNIQNSSNRFSVACNSINEKTGDCKNVKLIKVLRLNDKFLPQEFIVSSEEANLQTNEKADFTIKTK